MPIYEYVCKKCDHPFEMLVRGSEKPVCPSCGSGSLEKQFSVFAPKNGGGASPDMGMPPSGACGT